MASRNQSERDGDDATIPSVELPVGVPGKPYSISSQDGEIIYIPLSRSTTRLLVTGKESENSFAVVASSGSQSDPIGFHFHRETHDVFLCLKGNVNVWAGDQCRTMGPGDFASVPPNVVHQYQILGDHSEMVGLIVPGGWEEFFRFIGEPYTGASWPLHDSRNIFEVLIPKLKAAAEKFDMVPCPGRQQFDPSPWQKDENKLPGAMQPYFLKNAAGPAFLAGGAVCRPLITTSESNGKFAIGSVEGSSLYHDNDVFADGRRLKFNQTHHAFRVIEGAVEASVGQSQASLLHAGDLIYIPGGTAFSLRFRSRYVKLYAFVSGAGLVELLSRIGENYEDPVLPERPKVLEVDKLRAQQSDLGFLVC